MCKVRVKVTVRVKVKFRVRVGVKVKVKVRIRIAFSSYYTGKGSVGKGCSGPLLDPSWKLH